MHTDCYYTYIYSITHTFVYVFCHCLAKGNTITLNETSINLYNYCCILLHLSIFFSEDRNPTMYSFRRSRLLLNISMLLYYCHL